MDTKSYKIFQVLLDFSELTLYIIETAFKSARMWKSAFLISLYFNFILAVLLLAICISH